MMVDGVGEARLPAPCPSHVGMVGAAPLGLGSGGTTTTHPALDLR